MLGFPKTPESTECLYNWTSHPKAKAPPFAATGLGIDDTTRVGRVAVGVIITYLPPAQASVGGCIFLREKTYG
jgi:hypothetical protein